MLNKDDILNPTRSAIDQWIVFIKSPEYVVVETWIKKRVEKHLRDITKLGENPTQDNLIQVSALLARIDELRSLLEQRDTVIRQYEKFQKEE